MSRHKDANWNIPENADGTMTWDAVSTCVLMDIRDELKALNRIFACHNFLDIPRKLDRIEKNTKKRKRKGAK